MAIKNYTTKVDVYTSIGEIQGALARHGATKIMIDYDNGKPQAIAFGSGTRQSRYRQSHRCLPRRRNRLKRWRKRKPASSLYFDGREQNATIAAPWKTHMEAR